MHTPKRLIHLCDGRPKSAHMPAMIAAMQDAYRESITSQSGRRTAQEIAHHVISERGLNRDAIRPLTAINLARRLRTNTTYQLEPVCQDAPQSIDESFRRQDANGAFGDCEDYVITIAATLHVAGLDPGVWVFVGDAKDPWRHVVNGYYRRDGQLELADATDPNGFPWTLPPEAYISQIVVPGDPTTPTITHHNTRVTRGVAGWSQPMAATLQMPSFGIATIGDMPLSASSSLAFAENEGVGFINFKKLGQTFINQVIKPIGAMIAPIVSQLVSTIGGVLGTIIGGPMGAKVGAFIGDVWGGTAAALLNNESSISGAAERSMKTGFQSVVASLSLQDFKGVLSGVPGNRFLGPILDHPLSKQAFTAATEGNLKTLLQDSKFLKDVATAVPGVGPIAKDVLDNVDKAIKCGKEILTDVELAAMAAMTNVHGALQKVNANAVATFEGIATELQAAGGATTKGVGDPAPTNDPLSIAAALDSGRTALFSLVGRLIDGRSDESRKTIAQKSLAFVDGTETAKLPIRIVIETINESNSPSAPASTAEAPASYVDGFTRALTDKYPPNSDVPPSDLKLVVRQIATTRGFTYQPYLQVRGKNYLWSSFEATWSNEDLSDWTREANAETLVSFDGTQARLAWVSAQIATSDRHTITTHINGATVPLPAMLVALIARPDTTGPRVRPGTGNTSGDPYPARADKAQWKENTILPPVLKIEPTDMFYNPRYGTQRAGFAPEPFLVSARAVAADEQMIAADVLLSKAGRQMDADYRFAANPSASWIAFVLSKGGQVLLWKRGQTSEWLSLKEYARKIDEEAQNAIRIRAENLYTEWLRTEAIRQISAESGFAHAYKVLDPNLAVRTFGAPQLDGQDTTLGQVLAWMQHFKATTGQEPAPTISTINRSSIALFGMNIMIGTLAELEPAVQAWRDGFRSIPVATIDARMAQLRAADHQPTTTADLHSVENIANLTINDVQDEPEPTSGGGGLAMLAIGAAVFAGIASKK